MRGSREGAHRDLTLAGANPNIRSDMVEQRKEEKFLRSFGQPFKETQSVGSVVMR